MLAAAAAALSLTLSPVAAPASSVAGDGPRLVILAVPDLRWGDLPVMPQLSAFASKAVVGQLSVKTAGPRADCADGLLSFSAGNRVDSDVDGCGLSAAALASARRDAAATSFDAHVGAFGDALHAAGLTTEAADVQAVPLLATSAGRVDESPVAGGQTSKAPDVVGIVDDGLYTSRPDQRSVEAGLVDRRIADQLAELPPDALVAVVGISDTRSGHPHLHPVLLGRAGWPHVELARPNTRPPYVQLIDLAPTLLHQLGVTPPASMVGRVLHLTLARARDAAAYEDQDRHAQAARTTSKPLRYALALVALAIVVLGGLAVRGVGEPWTGTAATWLARLVVGVPLCVFLLQLFPWWRWGGFAIARVLAAAALVGAVVVALTARRGRAAAIVVVPALTALALLVDQLAGGPLQMSAPLGDNPLIAGRFHGMGNIDFALFATSALLCAGLVGGHLIAAGRRGAGLVGAAAIAGLALVVDGAPPLGDDAGGAVTLLVAIAVLLAVLSGLRVTWRRALVVVVGAAVAVALAGVADHERGAGAESHLGRFVGDVLHGGAGSIVQRRLTAVGTSFGNVAFTILVVAAVAALVLGGEDLRRRTATVPGLAAAMGAVATLAVLGSLLNDSGVVVAAFVVVLAVAAVAGGGLRAVPALRVAEPEPAPADGIIAR